MYSLKTFIQGISFLAIGILGQTSTTVVSSNVAVSSATATSITASTSLSPCGQVSRASAAAGPSETPSVPIALALQCLNSVPLHITESLGYVDYLANYLQFQSTLAYLANPPEGYLVPGVDIMGGLAAIRAKVASNAYNSQWAFETELNEIINILPKDGHLSVPIPLMQLFAPVTDLPLLSLSDDGLAIPKVYLKGDGALAAMVLAKPSSPNITASPVTIINGVPVTNFLYSYSTIIPSFQDPDALYNHLFSSIPFTANPQSGGDIFNIYLNAYGLNVFAATTNITFANGTSTSVPNKAIIAVDFSGINTGEDIFSKIELPQSSPSSSTAAVTSPTTKPSSSAVSSAKSTSSIAPAPTITGYPYPVVKASTDIVAGYFLNNTNYTDTAVLSILSFEADPSKYPNATSNVLEFQNVVQTFIAACVAANKTKLIVDVSANGGGVVMNGYDTFKQLFPNNIPFGGSRFRDSPVLNYLGNVSSTIAALSPSNDLNFGLEIQQNLDAKLQKFPNWAAEYGPYEAAGDNFTNLLRFNLSSITQTDGLVVTGYGSRSNITMQPFLAQNIVLMTDGTCGSTCGIFADMMKRQGGVRSIVIGGRPKAAPMQALGGIKGSSLEGFSYFQSALKQLSQIVATAAKQSPNVTLPILPYPSGFPASDQPPLGPKLTDTSPSVNARNAYSSSDPNGLPLQFVYEAANCRLFYTYLDTLDVTHLWQRVSNAVWGGAACVAGSTVNSNNTISMDAGSTVPWSPDAVLNVSYPSGIGSVSIVPVQTTSSTTVGISATFTATAASTTATMYSGAMSGVRGRVDMGAVMAAAAIVVALV